MSRWIHTVTSFNLHRWGNIGYNCTERMERCLSLQWNDYNIHSNNYSSDTSVARTKMLDKKYGESFSKIIKPTKNYSPVNSTLSE